ncbi:MAG: hypothetical protein NXI31_10835 [bacterium]|nr:hypothetical protein [bacterium]
MSTTDSFVDDIAQHRQKPRQDEANAMREAHRVYATAVRAAAGIAGVERPTAEALADALQRLRRPLDQVRAEAWKLDRLRKLRGDAFDAAVARQRCDEARRRTSLRLEAAQTALRQAEEELAEAKAAVAAVTAEGGEQQHLARCQTDYPAERFKLAQELVTCGIVEPELGDEAVREGVRQQLQQRGILDAEEEAK